MNLNALLLSLAMIAMTILVIIFIKHELAKKAERRLRKSIAEQERLDLELVPFVTAVGDLPSVPDNFKALTAFDRDLGHPDSLWTLEQLRNLYRTLNDAPKETAYRKLQGPRFLSGGSAIKGIETRTVTLDWSTKVYRDVHWASFGYLIVRWDEGWFHIFNQENRLLIPRENVLKFVREDVSK